MINMISLIPKTFSPEKIGEILSKLISSLEEADGIISVWESDGPLMSPGGPPAYSKVVTATWKSIEYMMAWTQGSGDQNDVIDDKDFLLANGAVLLFYEVKEV